MTRAQDCSVVVRRLYARRTAQRVVVFAMALSGVAAVSQETRRVEATPSLGRESQSATRPTAAAYAEAVRLAAVARAARDRGDAVSASASAEAARRLCPGDLELAKDSARLAFEAGDFAASAAAAEACLSLDPTDAEAWFLRARAVRVLAGPAAARDVLAAADRLRPMSGAAARLRAEVSAEAGDAILAERLFAAHGGVDGAALRSLLGAAERSGDDASLAAYALRLIAAAGTGSDATSAADRTRGLRGLLRSHAAAGSDAAKALVKAHFGAGGTPPISGDGAAAVDADALFSAAVFWARAGDLEEAEAALARALVADPRHGAALAFAAELRAGAGDSGAAIVILRRGLAEATDKRPLREEIARTAAESTPERSGESTFLLVPEGLRFGAETFPLAGAGSYVRLRAVRVAAGSPKAVLSLAPVESTADHVRRASDALRAAGFVRVRLRSARRRDAGSLHARRHRIHARFRPCRVREDRP